MRLPLKKTSLRTFALHPLWVMSVLAVAVAVWIGWQSWQAWVDRPITADLLQARKLRVNVGLLNRTLDQLTAYRAPAAPLSVTAKLFAPTSSSPTTNR